MINPNSRPFKTTIPGWVGCSRTDNKANFSPAELDCCWNWAELGNNSTLHLSGEEFQMAVRIVKLASMVVGIFPVTLVIMNSDSKLNAK